MASLLLVEDDEEIGAGLKAQLELHHFTVGWARTGSEAISEAGTGSFDLILLDLGLPDLDGFDVCRLLREAQPRSVLVILTASMAEIDVIVSLEVGADDYITKPFRSAELIARVRAHLRRGSIASSSPTVLRVGELEIDKASRDVRLNGQLIPLRAKEFDILARLAAEPGVTVPRSAVIADVWGETFTGTDKTLDVHMSGLRRRLTEHVTDAHHPPAIVTVRGRGYRLEF